jgi:hypothetical protein
MRTTEVFHESNKEHSHTKSLNLYNDTMDDDPKPGIDPESFVKELVNTILAERANLGISPDAMCSLDLRYDNSYIGGLLSDSDLTERVMMAVKCPVIAKHYLKPIRKDFPDLEEDKSMIRRNGGSSFDTGAEAVVAHFTNVGIAFKLTPIDEWGNTLAS